MKKCKDISNRFFFFRLIQDVSIDTCLNVDMQGNVLLKHTPTQSTYLLSHKERQPSDSVFKQQRFLERRKEKNVLGFE